MLFLPYEQFASIVDQCSTKPWWSTNLANLAHSAQDDGCELPLTEALGFGVALRWTSTIRYFGRLCS
jgi:hypothetical protein